MRHLRHHRAALMQIDWGSLHPYTKVPPPVGKSKKTMILGHPHRVQATPTVPLSKPRIHPGTATKEGGLVWFGSRLAPKAVTHGQCARTSLARLGTPLGCLVSQPPRLLTIPVPRQGADVRETPPCLYVWARVRGGGGGLAGGGGRRVTPWAGAWPYCTFRGWSALCVGTGGRCHSPPPWLLQAGRQGGGDSGSHHGSVPGPSVPCSAGRRRRPATVVVPTCPTPWHKSAGTTLGVGHFTAQGRRRAEPSDGLRRALREAIRVRVAEFAKGQVGSGWTRLALRR